MSNPAAPNYIKILAASCIQNAAGELVQSGSLSVQAVDGNGKPVAFSVGGGGIAVRGVIERMISEGSLQGTLWLAAPAFTSPAGIGYTFTIKDLNRTDLPPTIFPKVAIVADGSGNFDLSHLNVGDYEVAVPVAYVQGPPGPSGDSSFNLVAANTISGYTAVAVVSGEAVLADSATPAHCGNVVGLATATALSGAQLTIQDGGEFTFDGWNWTLGHPVVLGLNGMLTQTPPTSGFLQVFGIPLSPTSILLDLQAPITLA